MRRTLVSKTTILALLLTGLVFTPPVSPASASVVTSVGSTGDSINVDPSTTVALGTLLSHPLVITGFPDTENVLAILTASAGTLQETATAGVSAPLGYQGAVTNSAAQIAITGTTVDVNAALATVKYTAPSSGQAATISVSVTDAGSNSVAYNPANGHYYQYVSSPTKTWVGAYNAITGDNLLDATTVANVGSRLAQTGNSCAYNFNGMCGYFATVTTADESSFIANKVGSASAWLGGSDRVYEGKWVWSDPNAPEYNKQFSDQSSSYGGRVDQTGVSHAGTGTNATGQPISYTVAGVTYSYVNWNSAEPNNSGGNENGLQIVTGGTGKWNDLPEAGPSSMGYIVEYGGKGEVLTLPTALRTINVTVTVPVPTLGTATSTADGFTVQISSYLTGYTSVTVTTSAGAVSVSGSGLITVTGLNTGQSATITVRGVRAGATSVPVTATGSAAIGGTLTIVSPTNGATLNGNVGVAFNYAIKYTGGHTPETATVSSGTLPNGLSLSTSGVISGTPTTVGTSVVSLTITGNTSPESATVTGISIVIGGAPLSVTSPVSGTTFNGTVGTVFSANFVITGGTAPDTVTVTSGSLPAGLSMTTAGVITGTPTSVGTSTVAFHVVDSASASVDITGVQFVISPDPSVPAPTDFSMQFNGTSQYASTSAQVIPSTGPFTVEAWVNPSEGLNTYDRTIVSQGDTVGTGGSTGNRFYMKRKNGQLFYFVDGQAAENKCGLIPQGQWTHIAVTVTSTTAICYLNGVLQVTTSVSGAHNIGPKFVVGGYQAGLSTTGTKFVGQIDEVKVWNIARTLSDITSTKDSAPRLNASNLTAYYDFNAGAGLVINNTANGSDAVAASNLSTVGFPLWTDNNSQSVVAGYTVTKFNRSYITSSGGWTAPLGVTSIDVMVVGGGGGGGKDAGAGGGGGGAYVATGVSIDNGALVTVKVATGGNAGIYNVIPDTTPVLAVDNSAGGDSVINVGSSTFTGGGGAAGATGTNSSYSPSVAGGTASGSGGSAYNGAASGAGYGWGRSGGLGSPGQDGTFANNWLGSPTIYGGGGAGGSDRASSGTLSTAVAVVLGGAGGGGNSGGLVGGVYVPATSGAAGTGGGGGGGLAHSTSQVGKNSAAGGSGIALIRYQAPVFSATTPTFGGGTLGVASTAQSVTVTNSGSSNLVFGNSAVSISGLNASDFSIGTDGCSNQSVGVNATCVVTVIFTPSATGTRSAVLNFKNNAYGNVQVISLIGSVATPRLTITAPVSNATINGTNGTSFTSAVTFTGGAAPVTVGIATGSLPAGLSIDSSGSITGTPTANGTFSIDFLVTDANGDTSSVTGINIVISAPASPAPAWTPPAPVINNPTPPTITSGSPLTFNVSSPGATGYSVSGGALPAGLTLNPTTGAITGTPTGTGPYSFTINVTNAYGVSTPVTYSGVIAGPVTSPTNGNSSGSGSGASGSSGGTGSGSNSSGSGATGAGALPSLVPITPPPSIMNTLTVISTSGSTATSLNGNVSVLVNGTTAPANLKPNTANNGYVLEAQGWTLNLQPLDSAGKPVPLNGNSQIVLASNRLVGVTGEGFLPNSIVNVYLFSTPKLLGTVTTDANGKFAANFPVTSEIPDGNHVIQVNGLSPTKEVRSASVGLLVDSKATSNSAATYALTKSGSMAVIPFGIAKFKIGSAQNEIIKKIAIAKNLKILVSGYASKTIGQDDIRISLDRALEVKAALAKRFPNATITAVGGGVTTNPLCAKYSNQCVVVKVSK